MSLLTIFLSVLILAVCLILGVLFALPGQDKRTRRREKRTSADPEDKYWEETVGKLEKHIITLRNQLAASEKNNKLREKDILVERQRVKHLQEKLSQEKSWREKEQLSVGRSQGEFEQLKKDLLKAQREAEEGHAVRLRLEREIGELKWQLDSLNNEKKSLLAKVLSLETNLDYFKKESAQLKRENTDLKRESKEVTWVAKSEYEKLEMLYKQKEKELERMRREARGI